MKKARGNRNEKSMCGVSLNTTMNLKYLLVGADAELDQRTSRVEPAAFSGQGNKPVLLALNKKKKLKINLHFLLAI